jgi:anti-sigma B factor antagonist
MEIQISQVGSVTVVSPQGDIDMTVAEQLRLTLYQLVDASHRQLVVDLGHVSYMDSSGLGALIAAMKYVRGASGDLKVCGLQNEVRALFSMMRLFTVIYSYTSSREAVTAWR